jgi:hypothetical protein
MRRILLTLAVALFSVAAPAAPASAATVRHKATRPLAPSPQIQTLKKLQDQRQQLEFVAASTLTVIASHLHLTLQQIVAKWQRVAICEVNGNWKMKGPYYSGIGFSNATWNHFGGTQFGPLAGDATPVQQVLIGMRITQTWIPDQYGCSPVGW